MRFQYNDGGRAQSGFRGTTGDCVTRAIAIVTGKSYREVYDALNSVASSLRQTKRVRGSSSRNGVTRAVYEKYLTSLGWKFVPTMTIGSGCKVHLREEELPGGKIICRLSRHLAAVVYGVLCDTHDCSRNETRCVYGYFKQV